MNMNLCLDSRLLQQAWSECENVMSRFIQLGVAIKSTDDTCDGFTIAVVEDDFKYDMFDLIYRINASYALESNYYRVINGEQVLQRALNNAYKWFETKEKKVLLYLGKFPDFGFDIDGGSILAKQLINTLKRRCQLDIVFIRKNNETYSDSEVGNISYEKYLAAKTNKFARRMKNIETNRHALRQYNMYDIVITAHISKFFGMEIYGRDFWDKAILFPMFCTGSYIKAGEEVPREYTEKEREVLSRISKVITPSHQEKDDLISEYGCQADIINIVPRGINPLIKFGEKNINTTPVKIICIGSIKKQKNNMDALKLIKRLKNRGCQIEFHIVGTIQDQSIYDSMKAYIDCNELEQDVFYHIGVSQTELVHLLEDMHINISVSHWETFGRGIYEGISAGLPTFVYERLTEVKKICGASNAVYFAHDIEDMTNAVYKAIHDKSLYNMMHTATDDIRRKVSYYREQDNLLNIIFS